MHCLMVLIPNKVWMCFATLQKWKGLTGKLKWQVSSIIVINTAHNWRNQIGRPFIIMAKKLDFNELPYEHQA